MKRLVMLLALLPTAVFGAISGEWRGEVMATNATTHKKQKIGVYAKLTQSGSALTGTAGTQGKMVALTSGTVSGTTLTFAIEETLPGKIAPPPPPPGHTGPSHLTTFNLTETGSSLVGTVTLYGMEKLTITMFPMTKK